MKKFRNTLKDLFFLLFFLTITQINLAQNDTYYIEPHLDADRLSFIFDSEGMMLLRKDNDWSILNPKGDILYSQQERPFLIKSYEKGQYISMSPNFISRTGKIYDSNYFDNYVKKVNNSLNNKRVKEFNKVLKGAHKKLKAKYKDGNCIFYFGRKEIFRFEEFLYHYFYKVEVINGRYLYLESRTITRTVNRKHLYFDFIENKVLSNEIPEYLTTIYNYHMVESGTEKSLYSSDFKNIVYSNDTCNFRFINDQNIILLPRKKKKHILNLSTLEIDTSTYKTSLDGDGNILLGYPSYYLRIKNDTTYKNDYVLKGYLSKGHYLISSKGKQAVININKDKPVTKFKYDNIRRISENAAVGYYYTEDSLKVFDILNSSYSVVESGPNLTLKNIRKEILQVINKKKNTMNVYAQTGPIIYSGPIEKLTYHRGFLQIGDGPFCKYTLNGKAYTKTHCYDHIEDEHWRDNNSLNDVDLILAKDKGLWGIIDLDGKPLSSFIYDEVLPESDNDRMIVKKNDLWGVLKIDKN